MASKIGQYRWYIPDAFIPPESTPPAISHESICILNDSDTSVHVRITAYFSDRTPLSSSSITIPSQCDLHLRTNEEQSIGGLQIPVGVPYGLRLESDGPLSIQYSRLDSTQAAYSLMTVIPDTSFA